MQEAADKVTLRQGEVTERQEDIAEDIASGNFQAIREFVPGSRPAISSAQNHFESALASARGGAIADALFKWESVIRALTLLKQLTVSPLEEEKLPSDIEAGIEIGLERLQDLWRIKLARVIKERA